MSAREEGESEVQVKKDTAEQRGIVPFHVKGKAELWYHLKDLLRNQNRERHMHHFRERTSQRKQTSTLYFNMKTISLGPTLSG